MEACRQSFRSHPALKIILLDVEGNTVERFGENLLALRKQRGMSQEALARQADLALNSIHRMEAGRTVPGLGSAARIARALGVTVDDLIGKREAQVAT